MSFKIAALQKSLGFLQSKGLDSFDWETAKITKEYSTEGGYSLRLRIDADKLTAENLRQIKRIFGPMKPGDSYMGKNLEGEVRIDGDLAVHVEVHRAYACERVNPEELSEEKWDDIKEKARSGLIEIQDCSPVDLLPSSD